MRRRTVQAKRRLSHLALCCLISLSLLLSAVLWDKAGQREETVPAISLLPKTDRTVLVLGKDAVGHNTDVILLCRLDGKTGRATLLQIPRDTFIAVEDTPKKLNALYGICLAEVRRAEAKKPEKRAMETVTSQLAEALGTAIDDYILLDLRVFRQAVDAVGGVTLTLPADLDYDDPEQGLHIHLKQGSQTLNGEAAEQFIRFRADYIRGDLGRIDAQKLFLAAFFRQVREEASPTQLIALGEILLPGVVTSLAVTDLPGLIGTVGSLPLSAVRMATAPGETTQSGRYYVLNRMGMTVLLTEAYRPGRRGFDPDHRFRGFWDDEIRGLYYRSYEGSPLSDAETITEEGIHIPSRAPS